MNDAEARDILRAASRIARRTIRANPGLAHLFDDLRSAGIIAACEAARRFNNDAEMPLLGFLERRMQGAMIDWLRKEFGRVGHPRTVNHGMLRYEDAVQEKAEDPTDSYVARLDLHRALTVLGRKHRTVLYRTAVLGEFLHELAQEVSVSEAAMCQRRGVAVQRMRLALGA